MKPLTRRLFLGGAAAALLAGGAGYRWWTQRPPLGMTLTEADLARGRALLQRITSIDIHAHPGRSFLAGGENLSITLRLYALRGSFEADTIADMQAAGLTVAGFSTVSDFNRLDLGDKGLYAARPFAPGEAWRSHRAQMARLSALVTQGLVHPIRHPDDMRAAKAAGRPGALFMAEGAGFLEGRLERLDIAHEQGLRAITLMHYAPNEVGDVMTESRAQYDGLSDFGKRLVRAMNRLGMIIDVSHAAPATVRQVLAISQHPVVASHSNIRGPHFDHPRFLSADLAKAIAEGGGLVGAWPAGIQLASLSDFVDQIFRMVDLLGVAHVAVGSDMDGNYKPVYYSYRQLPFLAAALLKRGMSEAEAAQVLGGNYLRLFRQITSHPNTA